MPSIIIMSSTDAFIIKHYTILTSCSNRAIYIKLTDTIGYVCYEANLDSSDFHLSLPIESIYQLIAACFAEDVGYLVDIGISGKTMTIRFRARINNYISFDFSIHVKEKIITSDGQLTLNFNRMEERQMLIEQMVEKRCTDTMVSVEKRIINTLVSVDKRCTDTLVSVETRCASVETRYTSLEKRCSDTMVSLEARLTKLESILANAEVEIRLNNAFISLGTTSLSIPADNHLKIDKIQYLYNLQSLSFSPINLVDLSGCKNSTVKELHLYGGGLTNFRSLLGIENMPNLEHISIMNAPGISHISEIFPSAHKIRTLRIKGCAGINMEGLQIYCTVNKIALNKG